jgi:hypothetical protein
MMLSRFFLACLIFTAFAIPACKKKDNCTAGTGGNLTIVASPKHHAIPIPNKAGYLDTVYLKFNTQEMPATLADYDTLFVGEAGESHVHLEGLKCGSYYIFATGYDTTINARVRGGIPYSTDQNEGEIDLAIPVTED